MLFNIIGMKQFKRFLSISIFLLLFNSCEDSKNIEVTLLMPSSGTLKVQILDGDLIPLQGAIVKIYEGNPYQSNDLKIIETDSNGLADFGVLNEKTYYVICDVAWKNIEYSINQLVQVIAGEEKSEVLNVLDYTGEITIQYVTRFDYYDNVLERYVYTDSVIGPGYKVALIPRYETTNNYNSNINYAHFQANTNIDGVVLFKDVPAGLAYVPMIYVDEERFVVNTFDNVYSNRKDSKEYTYYLSEYEFEHLTGITLTQTKRIETVTNLYE
jgi:hypothetical protein